MITEDYVSFETAKLLKEKGFDENTSVNYFIGDDKPRGCIVGEMIYHKRAEEDIHLIACPTLQMAMKWLREVHKLVICVEIGNENFKGNTDYSNPDRWFWFFVITNEKGVVIDAERDFVFNEYTTNEEACDAAIKYCLENLI